MKALFIGGTGTISTEISKKLAREGHDLYLINRGKRNHLLASFDINYLTCDINDEDKVAQLIDEHEFDVVVDFIAFVPHQLERDYRLFRGKTKQFIFISSASAYQKPLSDYRIDEGTPLSNPYWQYSRDKIACEEYLTKLYREEGFPITIVRPSHTYCERRIPVGLYGNKSSWAVASRMLRGKQVIVHGDGTSLWTMTQSRDFAVAFTGLMGNIHAIGEAVNITSDESLTWNQIYQALANALGVEYKPYYVASTFLDKASNNDYFSPLIGDKANTVVFDNAKIKRLVPEFNATIRFDQGVKETVEYILSHPELQEEDPEFDAWCDKLIATLDEAAEKIKG
jgi:nucleoside-diphosphate-sugar epimerase